MDESKKRLEEIEKRIKKIEPKSPPIAPPPKREIEVDSGDPTIKLKNKRGNK